MKIAVLADSHGASLQLGWKKIGAQHPDVELTFFAQRGHGLSELRDAPGCLIPGSDSLRAAFRFTSNGLETVEIANYDAILVYGLCAAPFFRNVSNFHSSQVLQQTCLDLVTGRLSHDVVTRAHRAGASRIYVGHDPLPLKGSLSVDWPRQHYLDGVETLNCVIYTLLGARMIPQPIKTTTGGACTPKRFLSGARRLSVGDKLDNLVQPANDPYRHMNADFGALWLSNFLPLARERAS